MLIVTALLAIMFMMVDAIVYAATSSIIEIGLSYSGVWILIIISNCIKALLIQYLLSKDGTSQK